VRKVAPTQRHFKDSCFDFSRQRSLWRGTNNNNKNTRLPWTRQSETSALCSRGSATFWMQ